MCSNCHDCRSNHAQYCNSPLPIPVPEKHEERDCCCTSGSRGKGMLKWTNRPKTSTPQFRRKLSSQIAEKINHVNLFDKHANGNKRKYIDRKSTRLNSSHSSISN